MLYTVKKRFGSGKELFVQDFKSIADAEKFIDDALKKDEEIHVNSHYALYEGADCLREFDQSHAQHDTTTTAGQSQPSASTFHPTPFNTTPRPGNLPHHWIDDEKEQDKK